MLFPSRITYFSTNLLDASLEDFFCAFFGETVSGSGLVLKTNFKIFVYKPMSKFN